MENNITWGFDRFGNWSPKSMDSPLSPNVLVCSICDCCDDPETFRTTAAGKGPICQDCWADLIDPDQTLLLGSEIEAAENRIDELEEEIRRLTS